MAVQQVITCTCCAQLATAFCRLFHACALLPARCVRLPAVAMSHTAVLMFCLSMLHCARACLACRDDAEDDAGSHTDTTDGPLTPSATHDMPLGTGPEPLDTALGGTEAQGRHQLPAPRSQLKRKHPDSAADTQALQAVARSWLFGSVPALVARIKGAFFTPAPKAIPVAAVSEPTQSPSPTPTPVTHTTPSSVNADHTVTAPAKRATTAAEPAQRAPTESRGAAASRVTRSARGTAEQHDGPALRARVAANDDSAAPAAVPRSSAEPAAKRARVGASGQAAALVVEAPRTRQRAAQGALSAPAKKPGRTSTPAPGPASTKEMDARNK